MTTQTLEFTCTVGAAPAQVYRAWTRAVALREWLCDAAIADARPGGRVYFGWNSGYWAAGEYTALEPDARVAFTWQGKGEPGPTQIEVTVQAAGDGAAITLVHRGLGEGPAWDAMRAEAAAGWQGGMENLASVLETGLDLRFTRRPMLGILLDEFNAEIAARLGVPVTEGIRLTGAVEGMGAQRAGLQKDDVVVAMGGKPTTNYPELTNALQGRHAGDVVTVEFYRGSEKMAADMALSQRPMPEVPPTPQALAEAVQALNARAMTELAACFEGVTTAQASHRPAPGEWSALDVLAHFVAAERETQAWITDLLNDDERWSDRAENPTNVPARIDAITQVYPTAQAMLDLLRRSQAETVAMLADLPPAFVAHKGSYWRLGRDLLTELDEHVHEHAEQIKAAIAAPK
jgi:uncharacterized protein YndB with AHSA1/START domain